MQEEIKELLQERRILSAKGTVKPGKELAYDRVQKLIKLHPNDKVWVRGVASTAFMPNTQHASFIDVAQERGIVDDDYLPIDDEVYEEVRDGWDAPVYEPSSRNKVESFFDEALNKFKAPDPIFHGDDDECW